MPIGKTAQVIEVGDIVNYGPRDPHEWIVTYIKKDPYTLKNLYLAMNPKHMAFGCI